MNNAIPVKRNYNTLDLVYTALGAVLIAVCSWISIPTTVPFTMQTFAVFFVLLALGGKRGTMSILVYILLGAVGMPVFAQFASGMGVLLGSTGGYIVGFLFTGLIYWFAAGIFGKKRWVQIASLLVGTAVLYAFGTAWFLLVYARTGQAVGIGAALAWCVIPFIVPDLIKMALAFMIARRLGAGAEDMIWKITTKYQRQIVRRKCQKTEKSYFGEGKNIEFKREIPQKHERFLKDIIAFADCTGGKVILGIEDKTNIVCGIGDVNPFRLSDHITNMISDACTPQIETDITPRTLEGKTVLVIDVLPVKFRPYYLKTTGKQDSAYIRMNGMSRPADRWRLQELELEGQWMSFRREDYTEGWTLHPL